jgi:hypothetical protein
MGSTCYFFSRPIFKDIYHVFHYCRHSAFVLYRDVSASSEVDNRYRETATERFELFPTYFSHLIKCTDKVPIVLIGRGYSQIRPCLPRQASQGPAPA